MKRLSTDELINFIKNKSDTGDIIQYAQNNFTSSKISFHHYMKQTIKEKEFSISEVIHKSNIQRNYGYQIMNGLKHPGRDKIISLCIAADFTLDETQRALTIAGEGILYPQIIRDSILIFAIEKNKTIMETNEILYQSGQKTL